MISDKKLEQAKRFQEKQRESQIRYNDKLKAKRLEPNIRFNKTIGKEHRTTTEIREARAKSRREFGNICITCGCEGTDGSHLFKTWAKFKRWNPANYEWIVRQCRRCHSSYELLSPIQRLDYWIQKGRYDIAQIMSWIMGIDE